MSDEIIQKEVVSSVPRAARGSFLRDILSRREVWTLLALLAVLTINALVSPSFLSIRYVNGRYLGSLIDIVNRSAPIMMLAIGMTLVIATRGIDLSVGSVIAISGAVAAVLIRDYPLSTVILASLGAGILCGLWNGVLVAFVNIQPIVATLILMVVGRGIAQMITSGQIAIFNDAGLTFVGQGVVFGIPFPIFIALAAVSVVYLLVRRTALGMMIEAVGANDRASYYAGINAGFIKLAAYVISGVCAAVAGLIFTGYIRGADANNVGLWTELDAILAVVIGGASLNGGRFYLFQSMIGVLIIQSIYTGILISGLSPEFNLVVKAVVILVILLLQSRDFRQAISGTIKRVRRPA